jgi:hypothetical protein
MKRLIEADGVSISYFIFGIAALALTAALAFTCAPRLLVLAHGGLAALLLVCAWAISRAARQGFLISPIGREDRADAY